MATKPGSGSGNQNTRIPTKDSGFGQDHRPSGIPGHGEKQINHRDTTVSRAQPRRDSDASGSGRSGGESK